MDFYIPCGEIYSLNTVNDISLLYCTELLSQSLKIDTLTRSSLYNIWIIYFHMVKVVNSQIAISNQKFNKDLIIKKAGRTGYLYNWIKDNVVIFEVMYTFSLLYKMKMLGQGKMTICKMSYMARIIYQRIFAQQFFFMI